MLKLGISVDVLDTSQLTFSVCNFVSTILSNALEYLDVVVFYNVLSSPKVVPPCAIMAQKECWGFSGTVIATNMHTAKSLIFSLKPTKKYLYIWDLEWTILNASFQNYSNVYQHPDLNLIVRSKDHFNIVEKLWKKPSLILEEFNAEQFYNHVR